MSHARRRRGLASAQPAQATDTDVVAVEDAGMGMGVRASEKWKEKEGWSEQRHTGTTKTHVCHLENKLPTQVLSTRAPATDEIEQACSMAAVWQMCGKFVMRG